MNIFSHIYIADDTKNVFVFFISPNLAPPPYTAPTLDSLIYPLNKI